MRNIETQKSGAKNACQSNPPKGFLCIDAAAGWADFGVNLLP